MRDRVTMARMRKMIQVDIMKLKPKMAFQVEQLYALSVKCIKMN